MPPFAIQRHAGAVAPRALAPHVQASIQPRASGSAPGPAAAQQPVTQLRRIGHAVELPAQFQPRPSGIGKCLPAEVGQRMGEFFGADFSGVRVFEGPEAQQIGAQAFTMGSDIYFAPGQYQPQSHLGQRLLGHELAHVVQQRAGRVVNPFGSSIAIIQDMALEAEADRRGREAAAWVQAKSSRPTSRRAAPGNLKTSPRKSMSVIQRMDMDLEYQPGSSSDEESLIDAVPIHNMAVPANLMAWNAAVTAGWNDGWDEGIVAALAGGDVTVNPGFPAASLAIGAAPAAPVVAPPAFVEDIDDEGRAAGYGRAFDRAADLTRQRFAWNRQNYPAIPHASRLVALAYNGGQCVYCNAAPSAEVDHVYPVHRHWLTIGYITYNLGQVNHVSNLVGSCAACNGAKGDSYLAPGGWWPATWAGGAWFPNGPGGGTIPARRGGALTPATW